MWASHLRFMGLLQMRRLGKERKRVSVRLIVQAGFEMYTLTSP